MRQLYYDRKRVRVLMVEEDENDIVLIKRALSDLDDLVFDFTKVDTLSTLREVVTTEHWDLILCDYKMNKFSAVDVLEILTREYSEIPFIMVSGTITERMWNQLHHADGISEFISKQDLYRLRGAVLRELTVAAIPDQILGLLGATLRFKDNETAGHSRRVVDLSVALARKLKISETRMNYVRRGAMLHDIGKVGVPDYILLKPGMLTDEEMEAMKQHPLIARDLLSSIKFQIFSTAIPIYHHERWNGSGYPFKLVGEQIPLLARIFAVVDVYDALVSHRPYREAVPVENALKYLEGEKSILFDPVIVDAFVEMMRSNDE